MNFINFEQFFKSQNQDSKSKRTSDTNEMRFHGKFRKCQTASFSRKMLCDSSNSRNFGYQRERPFCFIRRHTSQTNWSKVYILQTRLNSL